LDAIDYLFSLERLGMKFGLENISRLCAALGDPQKTFPSVIVAGTNGKGSVTAMVDTALRAAGHRAARYTSPHLVRVEERFVIDGREVDTAALREAAARVRSAADGLERDGALEGPPTFFECATAIAFVLFREARVDVAVLEVGLGGRLDATNVVSPMAAAITSIDFDHQAQLGDTLASIAFEKAGVIKPGIPVVCGPLPDEARAVVARVCDERGATLIDASSTRVEEVTGGAPLALAGAHQRRNAGVAVRLLQEIDRLGIRVDPPSIRAGLTEVRWPARLERLTFGGTEVLLDAAHNPAGADALARYLRESGWIGAVLLAGVMRDKDAPAMLAPLLTVCPTVVCTTPASPRALDAEALAAVAREVAPAGTRVEAVSDPEAALTRAADLGTRVVAAGSIFLAGPLRAILQRR
jgi:dihydrofolate synthase/folylpolyglutamate synthase